MLWVDLEEPTSLCPVVLESERKDGMGTKRNDISGNVNNEEEGRKDMPLMFPRNHFGVVTFDHPEPFTHKKQANAIK